MHCSVGMTGRAETLVTAEKTAIAAGSGSLPVFGTPFLAALMEAAAVNALAPGLEDGESSVGTRLTLSHDVATPVGMTAWAEATVTELDRRRVVLDIRAFDSAGAIGACTHERFVVDVEKFMTKANSRAE